MENWYSLRNMSFESETCAVKNWSWLRGMKPHWGGYCRKWPNGRLQCADLGQLEYDKINKIWKQSVLYRICANYFLTFRALSDPSMVFCYQNCSDLQWEKIVLLFYWSTKTRAFPNKFGQNISSSVGFTKTKDQPIKKMTKVYPRFNKFDK